MNDPLIEFTNLIHEYQDPTHPEILAFKTLHKDDNVLLIQCEVVELCIRAQFSRKPSLWRRFRWWMNFPSQKDEQQFDCALHALCDAVERGGWNSSITKSILVLQRNQPYITKLIELGQRYVESINKQKNKV